MKQYWQKIVLRVDALSLRERAMVFVAAASILILLINTVLLDPQVAKQKLFAEQLKQGQAQIATIQAEIEQMAKGQATDPDAANRVRLEQLTQQSNRMNGELLDMQKGLVSPDNMAVLLEDILKRNGRLELISMKSLPVSNLNEPAPGDANNAASNAASKPGVVPAENAAAIGAIYKHGVEIEVQGTYLDMLSYMAELEAMPWQLFWGKAKLDVNDYPKSTLTLTFFTLSLDKKWLNL